MTTMEFWTDDARFGVRIPEELVAGMLAWCAAAGDCETGGILIGHYSTACDCAEVTEISGPPRDSRAGMTWFVRGVEGLQRHLRVLWHKENGFYLGEWHFHPYAAPSPSSTDQAQMTQTAHASQYQCPEPLLLVVGGSPPVEYELRAFVFPRHCPPAELKMVGDKQPLGRECGYIVFAANWLPNKRGSVASRETTPPRQTHVPVRLKPFPLNRYGRMLGQTAWRALHDVVDHPI